MLKKAQYTFIAQFFWVNNFYLPFAVAYITDEITQTTIMFYEFHALTNNYFHLFARVVGPQASIVRNLLPTDK